jgi:phospholipid/cholesterol/gamma-HCH transport system substrate-binding protein
VRRATAEQRRRSHFRAGLIALALAAIVLFLGFEKGIPGRHHYTVDAVFSSANNLLTGSSVHPGSPVRIAGVNVGQVSSISKGPGNTALVGLQMTDAGRPLHADATAKIRPRLFLEGNFFVELRPGSPSAPELKDGGTIPVTQTAAPVALYQVLDTFDRSTRDDLKTLVKEYAAALEHGGAQGLNRSYRAAPGAFRNIALSSDATLGSAPDDLSKLVSASARTSAAIAARTDALRDLITAFDRSATAFASRRAELARSLAGLDALERTSPPQLRAIDASTGPVEQLARAAQRPLRQSPPVLDDALPFLRRVAALMAPKAVPALVDDLGPTVRSLALLEPRLDELFGLVSPVTACVRTHALPVLRSKVDDGALSSGQTVLDEFLHAAGGLVSSSQNFDGNGFTTRFGFGLSQDVVASGSGEQQTFALGQYQGSRPTKPAQRPPFNPNAPCEDQPLPNLAAPAHNATTRTVGRLSPSQIRDLARLVTGDPGR